MKIEVGKSYVDENGNVRGPMRLCTYKGVLIHDEFRFTDDVGYSLWREDGKALSDVDLIFGK